MNINTQRAMDCYIGVPTLAILSLIKRIHRFFHKKRSHEGHRPHLYNKQQSVAMEPVTPTHAPQNILIILLSEMGSLVLAHPMFKQIKERYPHAKLYLLIFDKNREIFDLMELIPRENVLTLNDDHFTTFIADSLRTIQYMRQLKIDLVIDCELFSRISAIFSALSGASRQVGFHPYTQGGLYRGSFLTHPVMYNPYRHLSQQFIAMIDAIDGTSRPTIKTISAQNIAPPPQLNFSTDEIQKISLELFKTYPQLKNKKLILISPSGGLLPIRAWPLENYRQLCAELTKNGYAVGVIGKQVDKALGQDIVKYCNNELCVDLTGDYDHTLKHLLVLLHMADLLIANDGGISQFAALTPISVLTFFGPETPLLYGSNTDRADYLYLSMTCSPCLTAYNHRKSPCDGDNQCLKQIKVEDVFARALEKLAT